MNYYIGLFAAIMLFLNALIALIALIRLHTIAKDLRRVEVQGNSAHEELVWLNRALGVEEGRKQVQDEQAGKVP